MQRDLPFSIAQRQRRKSSDVIREHDLVIVDPRKDPCGGLVHPVVIETRRGIIRQYRAPVDMVERV